MRRREFLGASASAAVSARCRPADAQQPRRAFRVGWLNPTTADLNEAIFSTFRDELAARGYVEGRNVVFDAVHADGQLERFPGLARGLVLRRPDVVAAQNTQAVLALAAATDTIPIVMVIGNDPVAARLTASFARPSRNITGFSTFSEVLAPKRLDYLRQITPRLTRVGLLYGEGDVGGAFVRSATEPIARSMGISVVPIGARDTNDVIPRLIAAMTERLEALIVNADPVTYQATVEIAEFAAVRRLPAIYALRQMAVDGGLMALSYDAFETVRGAADYVARILAGTPVANLPFQQPRRVIFTINLRSARRAGIEVPIPMIALADEVIE